jgi:hypothetical protein
MVLFTMMLILLKLVKIELCGELLVVLTLPRFSCTAGFFLASLIIQPSHKCQHAVNSIL